MLRGGGQRKHSHVVLLCGRLSHAAATHTPLTLVCASPPRPHAQQAGERRGSLGPWGEVGRAGAAAGRSVTAPVAWAVGLRAGQGSGWKSQGNRRDWAALSRTK